MSATTSSKPAWAAVRTVGAADIVGHVRPASSHHRRSPHPRPALPQPPSPSNPTAPPSPSNPTPSPAPSSPLRSPVHPRQTPLHRGCAGRASPVEGVAR